MSELSEPTEDTETVDPELDPNEGITSRRRLFQMGAAGVAAVAGAAAFEAVTATSASAATGGNMIIGDTNDVTDQSNITLLNGGPFNVTNDSTDQSIKAVNSGGVGIYGGGSGTNTGVQGVSAGAGAGVTGSAAEGGIGVYGTVPATDTFSSVGVKGEGAVGVQGVVNGTNTNNVAGVQGVGAAGGVGVQAENAAGQSLYLSPYGSTTLPTTDVGTGSFIVLSDGSLHYAYAENTWVQLNNGIVTLPAPVRIIDTTSSGGSVGGIVGPLAAGAAVHTTSVLTGAHGIPSQALGLIGNFAISGVNGALLNGLGVATIFPAGAATPATANINAGNGCFAISNTVTVALGTGGNAGKLSIVWGGGGAVPNAQAFFDVSGYIL